MATNSAAKKTKLTSRPATASGIVIAPMSGSVSVTSINILHPFVYSLVWLCLKNSSFLLFLQVFSLFLFLGVSRVFGLFLAFRLRPYFSGGQQGATSGQVAGGVRGLAVAGVWLRLFRLSAYRLHLG